MDKRGSSPAVGASSLLVIFAVLCLTVFAMLSLNTVHADKRLSDACAQSTTDYYAADARAEQIFARLRAGEIPAGVTVNGDRYSYACPVSEIQSLCVELKNENGTWIVLRWQSMSTTDWNASDELDVWDGEW